MQPPHLALVDVLLARDLDVGPPRDDTKEPADGRLSLSESDLRDPVPVDADGGPVLDFDPLRPCRR